MITQGSIVKHRRNTKLVGQVNDVVDGKADVTWTTGMSGILPVELLEHDEGARTRLPVFLEKERKHSVTGEEILLVQRIVRVHGAITQMDVASEVAEALQVTWANAESITSAALHILKEKNGVRFAGRNALVRSAGNGKRKPRRQSRLWQHISTVTV